MIARWLGGLVLAASIAAEDSLKDLQAKLTTGDARARRAAVQALAKLEQPEAWKLVLGVLGDANSQVADEAQLQIARISDDKSRELLLGKGGLASKDEWVRVRVVEAFGRMESPPPFEALLSPLRDKDLAVRRTAAWTLERVLRSGALKATLDKDIAATAIVGGGLIGAIDKEKDAETRAAQHVAFGTFIENRERNDFDPLISDKTPAVRAAAVILARDVDLELAAFVTDKLARDPNRGVRLLCAELFAERKSKVAAQALVDSLAAETELAARWRMVDLLRTLSGQQTGLNVEAWRGWARALPDDWKGDAAPAVAAASDDEQTVSFAGLTIRSTRVAFLIDLSGSVWERGQAGRTKKQVIDEELTKALTRLPEGTRFNVIPYTAKPIPWSAQLVPAEKKSVAQALEFFTARKDTGTGNFWDALELALADPDVDTVVALTDGAPTGGRRWNLGLMKQLFAERNRFRRVVLDAILADAPGHLKKEWIEMCASSGGRVVEIELR